MCMRKLKNEELKRKSVADFKKAEKNKFVLVLDKVRSALNVGSAFRTADAFLVEKIYLCGNISCHSPTPFPLFIYYSTQNHLRVPTRLADNFLEFFISLIPTFYRDHTKKINLEIHLCTII